MKPLTANLKTLYQFPRIWLFHSIVMIGILMMLGAFFIGLSLLLIHWYGVAIGSIIRGSLRKPFAFCLSGHIKNAQKLLFLIWLAITIIYALFSFMDLEQNYALFIGSIGFISLSFWSGVVVIVPKGRFISFATILIILITLQSNPSIYRTIQHMPLAHAWAIAFVSGILSYLIYRAVGSKENVRRLCAMSWLGSTATSKVQQNRFKRERMRMNQVRKPDRASVSTGAFFSKRIRSNQDSMLLAHLCGQVYFIIGSLITYWRGILIGALCILILNCFPLIFQPQETLQQAPGAFIFLSIIASVVGSGIFIYNRYAVFLLIGRKERLWRGIVFLFSAILIILGLGAASVLFFNLLSGSLLPILFQGTSFLPPIGWRFLLVLTILIPLYGGLVILLRDRGIMILMAYMIVITVAASLYAVNIMENTPFVNDILLILSTAAITWGFHLAVLYYDNMRRSLC